jgi:lipooligosaccharide transport system permease protein
MLATPIGTRDIVLGHQLWMTARVASTSAVYLAVIAAFGGVNSPLGILALPAAVLLGAAFTTPFAAYAATRENEAAFVPVNRFVVVPMFLFSGTFFPVSRLPLPLEWLAYATPLWHGVELCRMFTLGHVHALPALGHAVYLLLFVVIGYAWALRTYAKRLLR